MSSQSSNNNSPTTNSFGGKVIVADVPLKELVGYSTAIRSMTQGTASFTMEFSRYGDMSGSQQESVLGGY